MGVCKAEIPRKEIPTLQLSPAAQLPEGTNCLACSEDGRYLSMGHSQGLSVWCASSLVCVAEWLQDTLEITFNQMTRMAETVYLLGTVDDMGVARIFAYQSERVHLLSVINPMENVNKRSICLSFELSEGGDYGVASMSCNGDVWLEVYQLPTEIWMKQLETVPLQKQDPSGEVDAEWSQFAVVLKIKPAGTTLHKHKDMKLTDFFTHCLSLDVETNSNCQRRCTHHFLLPCGQSPDNDKTELQPGLPVAVCVWWSGSYNLLQYSLHTFPKKKIDVEPMPDVVWPNSEEILCSAASRCTRFVAVGLVGAMVCIWDRQSGYPLSVVSISAADSAFSSVKFKDCWPESVEDLQIFTAKVHFLVLCKSGAIFRITTGRGTQSCVMQPIKRPVDSRDLPTVTTSVPFLQSLLLMVQRNGKMFLQDVTNQTTVCCLSLPLSHLITTPCKPVYALSAKQKTIFIQGDPDPSFSAPSEEGRQSQLFIFCFDESDITKKYTVSLPDSPQQHSEACVNLEKSCNLYLKHRVLSVDERANAVTQKWKQLQETAGTLLLQHSQMRKCSSL
ncbi:WD repeat-containing protein 93 [Cheilinus undulatus]|uniref:WD repeat-containing protein 93 n=1 Tax=Cheilinus undulatus TaxID=241271 RepID=UPI001BD3B60A|nr:WD repeat-containing protein 93 [Cheilinus undulatus]